MIFETHKFHMRVRGSLVTSQIRRQQDSLIR